MHNPSKVGINPILRNLKKPGTSELDLERNTIDMIELKICTNSQKGTGTKMTEKLNNFEKFARKKNQIKFQCCSLITGQMPRPWTSL